MSTKTRDPLYIFLAFFVLVEFIAVVFVNVLASLPKDPLGWFRNSAGDISVKYDVSITPAGWVTYIWQVIYIWQAIWIIYVIANIFRTNRFGKVYLNPPTVPAAFLATYSLNLILNIAYMFTWDRQYLPVSFAFLALIAVSAYVCVIISYRAVNKHIDQLREHHRVDLWLNRIFIHNGILFYATWCNIATLLNFSIVLTYFADVEEEIASIVSLSILAAELFLYILVDFSSKMQQKWVFMVYPVVIWASTAMIVNYLDLYRNAPVTYMLLIAIAGFSGLVFVRKLMPQVIWCFKSRRYICK